MSYDLTLLRVPQGSSLEEAYQKYIEACEQGLTPAGDLDIQAISGALLSVEPTLERFDGEGSVELTSTGDGRQYTVSPSAVSMSLPYWESGERARPALARVLEACRLLCERFRLRAYDPQREAELDPATDMEALLSMFSFGTRALQGAIQARRPWWKFWG